MKRVFSLEYWEDDGWFVGRLKEVPGVFSQGETLEDLKANIEDAYHLLMSEKVAAVQPGAKVVEIGVEV